MKDNSMFETRNDRQDVGTRAAGPMGIMRPARWRSAAWILMALGDVGLLAWGALAALAPHALPGPGGAPILAAGYEGFSGGSWQELTATAPMAAEFMTVVFRVYGAYIVAFGLLALAITATAFRRGESWAWWALLVGNTIAYGSAMAYDLTVHAIGSFELSEYLGLAVIYLALAVTAPFLQRGGQVERHADSFQPGRAPGTPAA